MNPDRLEEILRGVAGLRVAVVGDAMLDHYLWGDAERISPEAPVPVVDVDHETFTPGGAANVAMNLVALGARAVFVGPVGRDEPGRRLAAVLRKARVAFPAELAADAARPTIVKTRVLVRRQQLCRLDREEAPERYRLDPARLASWLDAELGGADGARAVVVSDYAKGAVTSEVIAAVLAAARRHGRFVAVDPKPRNPLEYSGPGLLKMNRREALQLAGLDPHGPWRADEVCARLHRRFKPTHLVVTLGEDGMLLSQRGKVVGTIPTAARQVFDVSGAGDTAIAAITLALAAGAGLEDAARFGNAASGVVVGKVGTATVTPDELRASLHA